MTNTALMKEAMVYRNAMIPFDSLFLGLGAWSGGIASAILIGAFAGLMPAVRASRMPPAVALRTV